MEVMKIAEKLYDQYVRLDGYCGRIASFNENPFSDRAARIQRIHDDVISSANLITVIKEEVKKEVALLSAGAVNQSEAVTPIFTTDFSNSLFELLERRVTRLGAELSEVEKSGNPGLLDIG